VAFLLPTSGVWGAAQWNPAAREKIQRVLTPVDFQLSGGGLHYSTAPYLAMFPWGKGDTSYRSCSNLRLFPCWWPGNKYRTGGFTKGGS
jgi:hypothetical protein